MAKTSRVFVLLAVLLVLNLPLSLSLGFNDLKNIEASCFKSGTCRVSRRNRLDFSSNWSESNCLCDPECVKYGDCCLDANSYNADQMMTSVYNYECVYVPGMGNFYMKNSCLPEWQTHEYNELCLQASQGNIWYQEKPFTGTPVTSHASDVTYKNFYCAMCNGEDPDNLKIWNARLSCVSDLKNEEPSHKLKERVQYINGSWGVWDGIGDKKTFQPCFIYPFVDESSERKIRECITSETECHPSWTDKETDRLCHSYTTIIYGPGKNVSDENVDSPFEPDTSVSVYRNYHCAKCNYVEDEQLTCHVRGLRLFRHYSPPVFSFSILFDFSSQKTMCQDGEIYDSISKVCRRVFCRENDNEFKDGRCIKSSERMLVLNGTDYSNGTLKCDQMLLGKEDYTEGENGEIIINAYRRTYPQDEYLLHDNGVLVCIPENYTRLMGWLTLFGLGLSCACIIIHLFAFIFVPELRNLSGKNLASLCVILLTAYVCFLSTTLKESSTSNCKILAAIMYYSFLASFTWMNVMAFDIWRTLQLATTELRVSTGRQWKKFIFYSLYAWLMPAALLIAVLYIDQVRPDSIESSYLPDLGKKYCWFGQRNAILVYFAAPLAFIMTMNILFFVMAVRMVAVSAKTSNNLSSTQPHQTQLKLYLRLALLMGLSWISGIVAGYVNQEYIWYLFILLNTLQGLFILLGFTCTKKVYRALRPVSWKNFKRTIRKTSVPSGYKSSRNVLDSQDSNNSNLSNTSNTRLSTVAQDSDVSLKSV